MPTPRCTPPPGPFEYRFAPSLSTIRLARHVLADWLELQPGVDTVALEDLLVVCSELVTNAIRHGEGDDRVASVAVRAKVVDEDSVQLEVEDAGHGFSWPSGRGLGDLGAADERGRGLLIVEALTDDHGVSTDDARNIVRCVKHGVMRAAPR